MVARGEALPVAATLRQGDRGEPALAAGLASRG